MESKTHQPWDPKSYIRFVAMIATATLLMYALTYVNVFQRSHVRWSETRLYMVLLMGSCMAIVMLAFMWNMYENARLNVGIVTISVVTIALSAYLMRSQTTVQDASYMKAMIPHHSIAILTSERAEISDIRVCELAAKIIRAQRREISEMEWLIADVEKNGPVSTQDQMSGRQVPDYAGTSTRSCSSQ